MEEKEIIQAVEEYFIEMLSKDADYFDHVTDSWIYDAKNWFMKKYFSEIDATGLHQFSTIAIERKNEIYDEKYGERDDALFELDRMVCNVAMLNKTFKRVKHHFKKFNTYTNTVSEQFEELAKNLQILHDIENGRVESLK